MEIVEGEVTIDIPKRQVSSACQEILDALSDMPTAADNFTIFRVPAHVRQRNKLLYEPRMVAIGPYNRRDVPSLRAMECLKLRDFQSFRARSGDLPIEDYVAKIRELEPRARQCYLERVELSTEKFVKMLLLDGCFIIEVLTKWNKRDKDRDKDGMFAAEWSSPLIRGDLLLLENQIPLFVLEELFDLVDCKVPSLMELLEKYLTAMNVESQKDEIKHPKKGVIPSLMKLLVYCLTCMNVKSREESSKEGTQANSDPCANAPPEAKKFHHLLHLYYDRYVKKQQTDSAGSDEKGFPGTIPSATNLLEAGVTIRRKKKNQNQKSLSSFLDVTFSNGVLEIPFLSVEPSSLPRFSNLVAFEQCSGCEPGKAYMTSYAVFMDCLIDTGEDAAILHQSGILENKLASDDELAVFFNQLSDWATLDPDKHYLKKLFLDVRRYCDSPWHRWRAKLVRDYFSNPWAIISVIAAAVLLFLTVAQTFYTIFPYYHPRN